jgi:hypothetical protein
MAEKFQLYLAARKDKEYWTNVYEYYMNVSPSQVSLLSKLRETIDNLATLERMG